MASFAASEISLPNPGVHRHVTDSFDGIPLHYNVLGTGVTTLILIHGWSCNQAFWRYQTAGAFAAYRLVALDLAGHGRSRATVTQRHVWSIEAFARDIETVADALGAERFALVGHSLGGAVALETAVRAGERCRMVLGVDTFTDAAFYRARPALEIAARLRTFERDFAPEIAAMVERITLVQSGSTSSLIAAAMSGTDPRIALAALEALLAWDIEARYPHVRCPVAAINSAALAQPAHELRLERLTVHAMDGVGHFPMLEAPERFNALASAMLARGLREP